MYYRLHDANREHTMLLDPTTWESRQYGAERYIIDTATGEEIEDVRHGVSACRTIEDLAAYLAQTGVPMPDDAVIVEVSGPLSDDTDHDANLGVSLNLPDTLGEITPVGDWFYELINAAYDAL